MHPRAGRIIRPFIATSRAEIRAFLQAHHIQFREDASNADLAIPRNRIRHELIPYLETRFSPGIIDVLDREATIAREDAEFLESRSIAAASRVIVTTPRGVEILVKELLAEPPAVARRVIRHAQQMVSAGRFVGFEAVEAVLAFMVSNSTGALDLPGHRVNRHGERVVLTTSSGRPPRGHSIERDTAVMASTRPPAFAYRLHVPGQVEVPEAGCAISADAERVDLGESAASRWRLVSRGDQVVIEAGQLAAPLVVRNRRPGDSFRPLGLRGHKKLQDFFVDAKVERTRRDTIPLVVDSRGHIVWVAGHALAEEFRVTDRTEAVVILKREPI
jgi:tRNA(Ile)-lysidine synthase